MKNGGWTGDSPWVRQDRENDSTESFGCASQRRVTWKREKITWGNSLGRGKRTGGVHKKQKFRGEPERKVGVKAWRGYSGAFDKRRPRI